MGTHKNRARPQAATSSNAVSTSDPSASTSDSTTTLIISHLPLKYTSESLSTLLSSVGPIRVAFIVTTQDEEKRSKGYGFAKFVLKDDAEKAIEELNGTLIDGKRITVQWAKRRQRVGAKDEADPLSPVTPPVMRDALVADNVKNAYAARRAENREQRGAQGPIDNKQDSRTVVLEGGLDTSLPENKKALQKRLKKVVSGINTGHGTLQYADVTIRSSTSKHAISEGESEQRPVTFLETPHPRTAASLAEKMHNTVLKGHLLLAKLKFESDLLTRKGLRMAEGRLIVRNLGFDVTEQDLAAVFAPYGFIQSIQKHKGYAFVCFLSASDAEKAIAGVNGKRIYAGVYKDRIEESANHKLSSIIRKEEKGRIVGVRGRIVAVDKALDKREYEKLEANGDLAEDEQNTKPERTISMDGQDSDRDGDDDDAEDDEDDDDDLSPIEDNLVDELEVPSDVEESDPEGKTEQAGNEQGTTLFIRNIQFEATEDELFTLFKNFGSVRYARIVMDPVTKRSRGTGFVNFYKEADALKCLQEADKLASITGKATGGEGKGKSAQQPSLLTIDPSSVIAASLTLHGRVLGVSEAVTKGQAEKLRVDRDKTGQTKDRRNLYLMHEGVILPESPLASSLVTADVQTRQTAFETRRNLLRTNPALYISRTRLAVRQLPLFVSEGMLRRLAGWAAKAFNQDVKAGKRSKLTLDELREPTDALGVSPVDAVEKSKTQLKKEQSRVKQAKILRQEDRVDLLTGHNRSKGYGFLEVYHHADALRILRWANGNADVNILFHRWWKEDLQKLVEMLEKKAEKDADTEARVKRIKDKLQELEAEDEEKIAGRQGKTLIIEFSIENAVTVKRRAEKVEKSKQKASKRKRDQEDDEEEDESEDEHAMDAEVTKAGSKKSHTTVASSKQPAEAQRNPLGSMIGKKRRLAKQGRK